MRKGQSDERKEEKPKTNHTLKHKANIVVRLRFFTDPSYLFGTALTCHFVTSMQYAQQPLGSSLCGFHVAFNMSRLLKDISNIMKTVVCR
jgi:hypothetical protein